MRRQLLQALLTAVGTASAGAGAIVGELRTANQASLYTRDNFEVGILNQALVGGKTDELRRFAEGRAMKTGTTIAGVIFEDGVVLGADTRATGGQTVCDRNCDKIHMLAANVACCGAGTSADAERVTEGSRLALVRLALEAQAAAPSPFPRGTEIPAEGLDAFQWKHTKVVTAASLIKNHLFRHRGGVSAALVLGGVDTTGSHLFQIDTDGSCDEVAFTAMGSGCLAALSVLEGGFLEGMSEAKAVELVQQAISAGIDNDLGSGSNVDICVITCQKGLQHRRGVLKDHPPLVPAGSSSSEEGTTSDAMFVSPSVMVGSHGSERSRAGPVADVKETSVGSKLSNEMTGTGNVEGQDNVQTLQEGQSGAHLVEGGLEVGDVATEPEAQVEDIMRGGPDMGKRDRVGGSGASRAWVGRTWRRHGRKSVLRVNPDRLVLERIDARGIDDTVEVL